MYAQEADLCQQELTTEVWSKPPERCHMMPCVLHSLDRLHSVTACFLFDCLDLPPWRFLLLAGSGVMFGFLILVSFFLCGGFH